MRNAAFSASPAANSFLINTAVFTPETAVSPPIQSHLHQHDWPAVSKGDPPFQNCFSHWGWAVGQIEQIKPKLSGKGHCLENDWD